MKLLNTQIEPYTTIVDLATNASCQVLREKNTYEADGTIVKETKFYGNDLEIDCHVYFYLSPTYDSVNEVKNHFLKALPSYLEWHHKDRYKYMAYCDLLDDLID